MTEVTAVVNKKRPRLSYISRRSFVPQKRRIFPSIQHLPTTFTTKGPISRHVPSVSSQQKSLKTQQTTEPILPSSNDEIRTTETNRTPTPVINHAPPVSAGFHTTETNRTPTPAIDHASPVPGEFHTTETNRTPTPVINHVSPVPDEIQTEKEKEQSSNDSKEEFNRWTPKQKMFFKIIIILLLITGVTVAAVVPPVYIFVNNRQANQQSSSANVTVSICSTTTCIGQETPYRTSIVTVLYPFDGNANDLTGYAAGTPFGSTLPTYVVSSYIGTAALSLTAASNQYIQIPYVDLTQSFTIQAWVYLTSTSLIEYGIFGQCDLNAKCLLISVRNDRFVLTFDSMNTGNYILVSSSVVTTSAWIHLTVVYNAVLYQQLIYVNGLIDATTNSIVAPYGGASTGSITTIGRSVSSAYGASCFQGRIDHFTISAGTARTACQIYNDASLVAYYPFDSTATFNDYSVNLFQGISSGTTVISPGRSGQALYFPSSASYFQAPCFTSMASATAPLSLSLWINPDNSTTGGSLVHVSSLQNGSGLCYDLLAFTSSGALVVQLMQTTVIVNGTQGPVIPPNTWTHVVVVFGATNGLRIYINGQLTTTSLNTFLGAFLTNPQYVTMGNNSPLGQSASISCRNGSIPFVSGPYQGAIDEFRLYNRELNSQEICVLTDI